MSGLDIAIVGCGIGGMAVANLLASGGGNHRITLFERFESAGPVGSGLLIQPTGQEVLARMGLLEPLKAQAAPVQRLHGMDVSGAVPLNLDYNQVEPGWHGLGVHRATLFSVLHRPLESLAIDFQYGATVLGRVASPKHPARWHVLTAKGATKASFDLIIDASGTGSRLRPKNLIRRNNLFEYGAVWTTVRADKLPTDTLSQRHVGATQMLGALPLGVAPLAGKSPPFAIFWSLRQKDFGKWRARYNDWLTHLDRLWPQVAFAVRRQVSVHDFQAAAYRDLVMTRFYDDGIAFIGDAAHSTSPQLGQGGNLALIDAWVLVQALSQHPKCLIEALEAYNTRRKTLVHLYQQFSRFCTPLFQSSSSHFGMIRNHSFPLAMRIAPMRHTMIRIMAGVQTGWLPWQHRPVNDILS